MAGQRGLKKPWETYVKDTDQLKMNAKPSQKWAMSSHTKTRTQKCVKKTYQYFHQFCTVSNIHGLKHLAARGRHWSEYFLWTIIVTTSVVMTFYVSKSSWIRFQEYPTVIVMEKNNKDWNITFPTATLCPESEVDPMILEKFAETYKVRNKSEFVRFFSSLSDSGYETFNYLPDYDEVPPESFLDIIVQAAFNFSHEVTSTLTLEKEDLNPIYTEIGKCYSYNSRIAPFFNPKSLIGRAPMAEERKEVHSCNSMDGDAFAGVGKYTVGFNVSISGPYEVPVFGSLQIENEPKSFRDLNVICLPIVTGDGVSSLSVDQRNCRIREDGGMRISPIYSYNLCRAECRLDLAIQLCGCIPYMLLTKGSSLKEEKLPICDVKGMKCLAKNGSLLVDLMDPITEEKWPCKCYPLCTDFHFAIQTNDKSPWAEGRLKWQIKEYPKTRYRRNIIFGFSDLMVGVGATAGLFLGASLLSFVEVVYFFTLRLGIVIYKKSKGRTAKLEAPTEKTRRAQRFHFSEFIH